MTFAREIHSVPSQSNYEAHAALCMTTCRPHSTSSLTDIIIKQPQYTSNTNKQHEKDNQISILNTLQLYLYNY